jgi:hypothetical protein
MRHARGPPSEQPWGALARWAGPLAPPSPIPAVRHCPARPAGLLMAHRPSFPDQNTRQRVSPESVPHVAHGPSVPRARWALIAPSESAQSQYPEWHTQAFSAPCQQRPAGPLATSSPRAADIVPVDIRVMFDPGRPVSAPRKAQLRRYWPSRGPGVSLRFGRSTALRRCPSRRLMCRRRPFVTSESRPAAPIGPCRIAQPTFAGSRARD